MKRLRLLFAILLGLVLALSVAFNVWLYRETQRLTALNAQLVDEALAYAHARRAADAKADEVATRIFALAEKLNVENAALRRELAARR